MVLKIYGHSSNVVGLLTIPTVLFTLMIAALATLMPGYEVFWFGVWCMCGIAQALGVYWALRIRLRHNRRT